MMFRRIIRYGAAAGAITSVVGLGAVLYNNHWQFSSLGIVRFGRAACTVADIAVDYKLSLRKVEHYSKEYIRIKSEVHKRSAEKLLKLCCTNGGVFIKVGQHVGAMDYLLPPEYVSTLRVLHSRAPMSSIDDVKQVLREEFNKEPSEIFETFDEEATGAASLAQVHRATLKNGQVVAVKVQHRRVLAHSLVDMKTMELLVHIVAMLFPEFSFLWLAEETKKNLPAELDFTQEAWNAEFVRHLFSYLPWLKIPEIVTDFTSTGKESVNATLPVGLVMVRAIRDYWKRTGYKVGFKPAGGIRTAKDVLNWQILMKEELGNDWLKPNLFRIGASALLSDIEKELFCHARNQYPEVHELSLV